MTVITNGETLDVSVTFYVSSTGSETSGSVLYLLSGGAIDMPDVFTVAGAVVSGGADIIFGGGSAVGTTVVGGQEVARGGGVAISATISSGGYEFAYSGGSVTDTTVSSGGNESIYLAGASALGTTVSFGGVEQVDSGGFAISTTVEDGGREFVYLGGSATSTTVNSGGEEGVTSGGTAIGVTVGSGGKQIVGFLSGGTASFTTLSGGYQYVSLGGTTSDTTVSSGGAEYVSSGGTAIGTTVGSGGFEVLSNGTASGTTVSQGGSLYGYGLIYAPVENDGQITANGGTLVISGAVDGTGVAQIDDDATLELTSSFAVGGTINFSGVGSGTLVLDDPVDFQGSITDVVAGDMIDLANANPASVSYTASSLTLALPSQPSETLSLSGSLTTTSPYLQPYRQSNGNYGTEVTFAPTGIVQIATVIYSDISPVSLLSLGSGIVIGPHSILTAAHVVWSASQDQSATSIEIAPYGSNGSGSISGTLQPFVGQPTAYNTEEASLGTIGSITGVYFYAVNDPGGSISTTSVPFDLAVINTSQDLTQYVQVSPDFSGGTVDLVGQLGSFGAALSYSSESGVTGASGLLTYQPGSFVPYASSSSPVTQGMSGGPALIYTTNGLQDVGVISTVKYAVQLTSADYATILSWEALGSGTTVNSGTILIVSAGDTVTNTTVNNGGTVVVSSGGTAISTAVSSGGYEYVSSGGAASNTIINSGGLVDVYLGGTASGTMVGNSGAEIVSSSGSAISTTVNSGVEDVDRGGTAIDTTVNGGGFEFVSSGGTATGTTLNYRGQEFVYGGGVASDTTANDGGYQFASSGGSTVGTMVDGGYEFVRYDGTALNTTVNSGQEQVDSGGTASATTVNSGGTEEVLSAGTAISTTVNGGLEYVFSGGSASGTTVDRGGQQFVESGAAISTTVNSGGTEAVYSGGTAGDTTVNLGGMIDLAYVPYVSGGSASVNSTDLLTVSVGGQTYTQQLLGNYAGESFQLAPDAHNDTLITATNSATTAIVVSSGQTSSGIVLQSDDTETVLSGGTAISTTVNSGGADYVYGVANGTIVSSGGDEYVSSGGIVSDTTVSRGGSEYVSSGGSAMSTTVSTGGDLIISDSGVTSDATVLGAGVSSGGEYVSSGGTAIDTIVSGAGAEQVVSSGGVASGTVVSGTFLFGLRSQQFVLAGGTATGTVVGSGGDQDLEGGLAVSTVVSSGGTDAVSAGGVASGTIVRAGEQFVFSNGVAIGTVVSSGGDQLVDTGGVASSSVISSGAIQEVFGGVAIGTTVSDGGEQIIFSGGIASGTTLDSVGYEFVSSGGTTSNTVVSSGGAEFVFSGGTATDTVVSSGGVLVVLPGGTQTFTTLSGGTIVSSGVIVDEPATGFTLYGTIANGIVVSNGGTEFILPDASAVSTTVDSGGTELVFSGGTASLTSVNADGTIDLPWLDFSGSGSASLNSSTDLLTVSEGAETYTQQLSGDYAGDSFLSVPIPASNGTDILLFPASVSVMTSGTVTVAPAAGETVSLDELFTDPSIAPYGTIATLIINGPGTVEATGSIPINNLDVAPGGTFVLNGAVVTTDPLTIDAGGNITGFGTLTGAETVNGTLTAQGGALVITGAVSGTGTLTVARGATLDVEGSVDLSSPISVAGTLTNAGTVSGGGGTAVTFASSTDRLIIDPGATFIGTAMGGGANTTLELAQGSGRGSLDALGTTFTDFGIAIVDAGATWTVKALASVLADTTITGSGGSNLLEMISAGTLSLGRVSLFPTITLAAGNNTVTVTDTTLSGGVVTIKAGTSGNNTINATEDTAASLGKTLIYYATTGTDRFTGKTEDDSVHVSAAVVGGDTLTGGSGANNLVLSSPGSASLSGVSRFATIYLAAGGNSVTVTDATLSGGFVTIKAGASGSNSVDVTDTAASEGRTLAYYAGPETDSFTGGSENDSVHVSATVVGGDTLTGGSKNNTLVLSSAGTFSLGGVRRFANVYLEAGNNTVTVTDATLSGGSVALREATTGNNDISAAEDTAASKGKTLYFVAHTTGTDSFTGGVENDTIYIGAGLALSGDTLTGGSGTNAVVMTSAGVVNLDGVSNFPNVYLTGGNNTVTVTDTTLSGGSVAVHDGPSGNSTIIVQDKTLSEGKTLYYIAGKGTDSFTGGFENDTVSAGSGNDTVNAGSGKDTIYAGTGLGTFTAGSGIDKFVFKADNLQNQTINDFRPSGTNTDDLVVWGIHVANGFDLGPTDNALNPTAPTPVDSSIFISNASGTFTGGSQRFAYDTSNGELWYSATGSNASEHQVATLTGTPDPTLTAGNILFQY